MSEDEIRNHLLRQSQNSAPPKLRVRPPAPPREPEASFENFSASHLLCPQCRKAMPVRERVLLFLPDGVLYDYLCEVCGTSLGTRRK